MVPFVLLALPAILSRPTALFHPAVPSSATVLIRPLVMPDRIDLGTTPALSVPVPWGGVLGDSAREMAPDGVEVRVWSVSTWATEGFVLRRRRGVWSGWRLEPNGWVQRPVAKETGAATLLTLAGFERWPDSPPPITSGNDVPLTTVEIAHEGRYRAFVGTTGGTDEARRLARLVREALA